MAEIIGSPVFVNTPGDVTVPSDAQAVLLFSGAFIGDNGDGLASVSLGGAGAFSLVAEALTTSSWAPTTGVRRATISGTGTQALTWAYTDTPSNSGAVCLIFVKGINPADFVRDADAISRSNTGADANVTIDSATDDLVLACVVQDSAPSGEAGWTLASGGTHNYGDLHYRISTKDTPGATSSYSEGSTSYVGVAAISIKNGSGGGGGSADAYVTMPPLAPPRR